MTFRSKTMKEVKIDQVLNEEAKNCNSQQEGEWIIKIETPRRREGENIACKSIYFLVFFQSQFIMQQSEHRLHTFITSAFSCEVSLGLH